MADTTYTIRLACAEDLPLLPDIERAAGLRFRDVDLPAVAAMEPTTLETLQRYYAAGRLWVAIASNSDGQPVGFALAQVVDGLAHLQELAVHPAHGGRGLGTRLIATVCQWAQAHGFAAITLSTFHDVPWNAPFYARRGFRILDVAELSPGLHAKRQREAQAGLPIDRRVCMRRELET